jgi:exopolysaccharide production protein ExoY
MPVPAAASLPAPGCAQADRDHGETLLRMPAPAPPPHRAARADRRGTMALARIADEALIRLFDIVGAIGVLVLAFPVMVLVALAVVLTSRGPVLFAHRRVGRGGNRFACLKFRTMVVDADAQLQALLTRDAAARDEWQRSQKLRHDPRVTSIGRFLRRTSLDELPQVFNVLRGDMSLVGPRPIVEAEIPRYGRHFAVYCRVRPGVTGLWQVQRHAGTSYRRRVAFDVSFARARSVRLYVLILLRTVPAVLIGRGAW